MAYEKVWPDGWKDNEEGGTYIDAAGLNKMEGGIIANDTAIRKLQTDVSDLKEADETTLSDAKRYADTVFNNSKAYSDTNLNAAKNYTDSKAASINASISAADEKITAIGNRLGNLTFAVNPADRGLDIIINI